jgi:Lrp/AsnC family transcriptional regulator, leucine-responsive regulatory protein
MIDMGEKDVLILEILQENCRISLTELSKKINLSVDSTKKRLTKLEKKELFYPKIQLRPRQIGYPNILEINIKLREYSNSKYEEFLKFLKDHPRVSQIIQVSGNWDLKIVLITKDYIDQGVVTKEIRVKFGNIILDWTECLTTNVLKFEKYDLKKLKESGDLKNE